MARVGALPPGPEREAVMHDARKKAKRLRYAAEVCEPVSGKPALRLQTHLPVVQDVLGDYQDTVMTRALLRQLSARDDLHPDAEFAYGLLYGIELARARQREQELTTAWTRMRSARAIEWFST